MSAAGASPRSHERIQPNGRVLRSTGAPMAGGGYVTSYTDITELRRAAEALAEANERLEARVADRTERLEEARRLAEEATASKTRFLAAASHDLLQPLHAARLFIAALKEQPGEGGRALADNADRSIESAHGMLKALLNLSRLEAGGVKPAVAPLSVEALFEELRRDFIPQARGKGLRLRIVSSRTWVLSDRDLLRSLLQNLIGNAVRYTDQGGIVVGVRRSGGALRFEVHDTGRGIPAEQQEAVFGPFTRLAGRGGDETGAALGLAIVRRVAALLDYPLLLRSEVGRGSTFTLTAPRAAPAATVVVTAGIKTPLVGTRVLCVDNEPAILEALSALLGRWGVEVVTAADADSAASATGPFDAILIDLHLGEGADGLDVIAALRAGGRTRGARLALISADTDEALPERALAVGVVLMPKPVRPAALKAFLTSRARTD